MLKTGRIFSILLLALSFAVVIADTASADDRVVFKRNLMIGNWHVHASQHTFNLENPGEGTLMLGKNTPDGEILRGFFVLNGAFTFMRDFLAGDERVFEKDVTLQADNTLFVFLLGHPGAAISFQVIVHEAPTPAPKITVFTAEPSRISAGASSTLSWQTENTGSCVIEPGVGAVDPSGSKLIAPEETTTYTITVTGPDGTASASTTLTVVVPVGPPTVDFSAAPAMIAQSDTTTLSWNSTNADSAHIDNGIGVVNPDGAVAVSPEHTTAYTITVTGDTGSASARFTVKVMGDPEPLPEGSFGEQYVDLIPPDATVESYDAWRFSLITGQVLDMGGSPIANVSITIHGHPEYGSVLTDLEGLFSIPVEGSGTLTIVYQKEGLISVHRKVYVPSNDIAIAETIQMIVQDPVSTTFTFDGNPDTVVTHQSALVTDEFGSRSASIVFSGDNRAFLVDENGDDVHELITITTRATEYITPESMPGKLPPTSAYTYCVELSVDGANRVRFEKPVIVWVDNFLGFDVGADAPVGFYDRDRGVWVPEKNGQVVKLLDTDADGIIDALDADGDDIPDDLDQNGSFGNEVKGLDDAQKYQPETIYWRIALDHFTPIDINWAWRIIRLSTPLTPHLPQNSISPNPNGEPYTEVQKTEEPITPPENDLCLNSYVKQRSRVFHEDIKIPQTDVTLHYASNRVDDYRHGITIPASGEMIPEGLKKIIVQVNIAGKSYKVELPAEPNQIAEIEWDGLDHLGRRVQNNTTAQAKIGFVYDAVYTVPPVLEKAFGMTGTDLTSVLTREQIILWKRNNIEIPIPSIKGQGTIADGWTVSLQHNLDIKDPTILHKGDGTVFAHLVTLRHSFTIHQVWRLAVKAIYILQIVLIIVSEKWM
jgi:hypothetical protein